jgi:hypothetical protein
MRITKTLMLQGKNKVFDEGDCIAVNRDLENVFTALQTIELRPRTADSDPQHATASSRPKANRVSEMVYYNGKLYFCTNETTPTWEKISST